MKKTDMELQAIREKLLSLQSEQSEPKEGEVLSLPWASPRSEAIATTSERHQLALGKQLATKAEATPPAVAIAALKQRSVAQPYGPSLSILGTEAVENCSRN